jgi:1-acyl-sn-glycerol-3-phosphate acyltransferase
VVEFLPPIEAGLPRDTFAEKLEQSIEAASDALLAETGLAHLYEKD